MRTALSVSLTTALLCVAAASHAQTLATGAPSDTFSFSTYATGLGQLTDFRFLPDGRVVLISRTGEVRVRLTDGTLVNADTFPVSSDVHGEQGLLGVEVDPSFATNRRIFFYYSRANSAGGTDLNRHRVVSITLGTDSKLVMSTEDIMVQDLRGPANHDGGALALSKDGTKLYVGVGDTGCNKSPDPPNPPGNYFPTCLTNGNGKILRINLDKSIPSDNPLSSETAVTACGSSCGAAPSGTAAPRKDIWAWGFRNPFRIWTDPVTGHLWVGDVGEGSWEEIDVLTGGGKHHGWPWREGAHGWPATKCTETVPNKGNCVDPVHEQAHASGSVGSITGGAIMDFCSWPTTFRGLYFFGDNATGKLWTVQPNTARDGVVSGSQKDFGSAPSPVSIRPGPDGAMYIASLGGRLYRFAPKAPVTCDTDAGVPDTGVTDTGTPADGGTTDAATSDTGTAPGDASTGSDTGVTVDSGSSGGDDAGAPGEGTSEDGGCGCSTPGGTTSAGLSALALAGVALAITRRRR